MVMCSLVFVLFLVGSFILYFLSLSFLYSNLEVLLEYELLSFNSMSIEVALIFDWASLMFTSFVFLISSLIIVYSSEYMESDKHLNRFIYLMVLFVLSMMVVILSSNLVFILLGWDGLGLVSYALVIYYQNSKSYNAGMLTALSNRVGDASILVGIAFMMELGSWSYASILEGQNNSWGVLYFLSLFIVLAAMTKSAQIPFSAWLPAAMAAPTPVSSLVHSSTLVTAGVYLLFRFSSLLAQPAGEGFVYFSLLTMFMAGLGANLEFDLKKIIALSTLSQLGMMMVIFFLGEKDLAFFHLLMHALFKALLFMCAGVIIHSVGGHQDIRYMGGLVQPFPITCACFCVSSFSLCGLPFLSGFYSKDLVAEAVSMTSGSWVIYLLFFISIGLTVSYSVRLLVYVFGGQFSSLNLEAASEAGSGSMLKSMMFLAFLAILGGSGAVWVGFPTPYFIVLPDSMKMMVLFMVLVGVGVGYEISGFKISWTSGSLKYYYISMFVSGMWNLPTLSTSSLSSLSLSLGKYYLKGVDYGWTEYYGSKGLMSLIKFCILFFQSVVQNHMKLCLFLVWGSFVSMVLLALI
uniref:NADH-ubiquinone oxidoreductase chain 5 n=1 Tax=Trigonopterus jasminae TaxID=2576128 RepID=A0A7H1KHU7_9CUCU|nr:NADH dehydrogenase subunit 5 [Trigonopterus jasminae]QNT26863.1 NADH dehydrogenase subunit 5 [Trigonopterus jasminae]